MYNKCISLRWLFIDEVSTASLYVLGVSEKNVRKAKEGSAFAESAGGVAKNIWPSAKREVGRLEFERAAEGRRQAVCAAAHERV